MRRHLAAKKSVYHLEDNIQLARLKKFEAHEFYISVVFQIKKIRVVSYVCTLPAPVFNLQLHVHVNKT